MRGSLGLLIGLSLIALAPGVRAAQGQPPSRTGQKQVLVLYSTRPDAQIAATGERDLPEILNRGLGAVVDYYSEFIDRARVPGAQYSSAFRDFLRFKYQDARFDLVVAIQDHAVTFVREYRDELFPGVPVVFVASSSAVRLVENATGMIVGVDVSGTLSLAAQLQPDLENVFVVSGSAPSDRALEGVARAQFRTFDERVQVTYLSGLATPDLEARLAHLPARSLVYYLLVNRDGAGQNVHPLEYLDRVTAVANAPVYCWVDSAMDRGIMGGSLKKQRSQTEALGELAVRVLRGERADSIPAIARNFNVTEVDHRQLQRWGISEARLPAGTRVLFRQPTAWDRYKVHIVITAAILLAQTTLIAGLLVQNKRRRRAEEQVRQGQTALRASYEKVHDLGARLLDSQETERARIARELHDDISQQLALLTIDLELLRGGRQADPARLAAEALTRAQTLAKSVHDLSHRLHPAKLRLMGLVPALDAIVREVSQPGISIVFTRNAIPSSLSSELTVCLFRVVQEALQNAVKYSMASTVSVHLSAERQALELTVADNGIGFDVDPAWGRGLGLISMQERVEAVGGTFAVHSSAGAGTRLEARVPIAAAMNAERPDFTSDAASPWRGRAVERRRSSA